MDRGIRLYEIERQRHFADLKVEVVGYEVNRTGIYQSPGSLDNHRIMLFQSHMPVRLADGHEEIVEPGTFTIFDSMKPSQYGWDLATGHDWIHSWVRVTGVGINRLLTASGMQTGRFYHLADEVSFLYWLQQIHREASDLRADGRILVALLEACLHDLHRKAVMPDFVESNILMACRWIDSNPATPVSLHQLAAMANYSISHFCALFREQIGVAPMKYAMSKRMQLATQLLEDTGLSVKQVADQCGFHDVYHFSRTFSKTFNQSPSAYRDQLGQM